MELKINAIETTSAINFNFEELKNEITTKSELYKNMVYTDDTIKTAKEDRASLNKFIKALEDKRKEVKKQCLEPYNNFEKQVKELVRIINESVTLIGEQITEFEEREKATKREEVERLFDETGFEPFVKLEQIFDPKWLNKSASLKSIATELKNIAERIRNDLAVLNEISEFQFEATETYKDTLDISKAIAEKNRLVEMQKRKVEYEATQTEQESSETEEFVDDEPTFAEWGEELDDSKEWKTIKMLVSESDIKELKSFCAMSGIEIEVL